MYIRYKRHSKVIKYTNTAHRRRWRNSRAAECPNADKSDTSIQRWRVSLSCFNLRRMGRILRFYVGGYHHLLCRRKDAQDLRSSDTNRAEWIDETSIRQTQIWTSWMLRSKHGGYHRHTALKEDIRMLGSQGTAPYLLRPGERILPRGAEGG
jgi:hypothetical protein